MAAIRPVEPVVRVCAVFSRYPEARRWAVDRLAERWGPIETETASRPFAAGGFYDRTMGDSLDKCWVAFERVVPPDRLADWKLATNALEIEYAETHDHLEPRPLNLDPGYVTQAKLILATTKDRDHRVYLRDGIFAEVTLSYIGKRWVDHRWTYPDYRDDAARDFVHRCRQQLRDHLQTSGGWRIVRRPSS